MYQVEWLQSALNELADAWTNASSTQREAITTAAQVIEQLLQSNPQNQGESRPMGRRILFHSPLGVTFRIHRQNSIVYVTHAWAYWRRH